MLSNDRYRILILCTVGSGGTWPPVVAVMKQLEKSGHLTLLVAEPALCGKVESDRCFPVQKEKEFTGFYDDWVARAVQQKVDPAVPAFLNNWANALIDDVATVVEAFAPHFIISCLSCVDLAWQLSKWFELPWGMINPGCYFGERSLYRLDEDFEPHVAIGFDNYYPSKLAEASLVLHATDDRFDPQPTPLPPNHLCCGPLDWENSKRKLPDYLNEPGDPWVLYSGSTAAGEDHFELLQEVRAVLAELPVRLIVTHRDAARLRAEVNSDRVYFEESLPHSKVMPMCALFLGPAGHGKVLKCLRSALPMVLFVTGSDQPGVARRAVATGAAKAIFAGDYSRDRLRDDIIAVLSDPAFKQKAVVFSDYLLGRHADSAQNAVAAVIRAIENHRRKPEHGLAAVPRNASGAP